MADQPLNLNDPVTVTTSDQSATSGASPLQGVVAFLGPVKFATGDDWVGVRLTGPSVGLGKNDGTVKGERYFDGCGPSGGVFVRAGAVKRRTLTRLEELRLKRELSKASGGGSGEYVPASSPKKSPRKAAAAGSSTSAARRRSPVPGSGASVGSVGTAGSAKSRLDEIRAKRAALAASKESAAKYGASGSSPAPPAAAATPAKDDGGASPAATPAEAAAAAADDTPSSSPSTSAAAAASAAEVRTLKSQLSQLQTQLTTQTEENAKLQSTLSSKENEVHQLKSKMEEGSDEAEGRANDAVSRAAELESELARMRNQLAAASLDSNAAFGDELDRAHAALDRATSKSDALEAKLDEASKSNAEGERRLAEVMVQLDAAQEELDREKELRAADAAAVENELTEARASASEMKRELSKSTEIAANRGASEQSHYRERARLEAECGTLRRQVKSLESEKLENESALEELALDRESLTEEREGLVDKLEELRLDKESAEVEVEELRMELEECRERVEELEAAGATGAAAAAEKEGGAGAEQQQGSASSEADDVARALSIQNTRLRDAIVRLREQSTAEKVELNRQLRSLERDAEQARSTTEEVQRAKDEKSKLVDEVRELKEMVDQGSAFEGMVEELSDRVMALEDDVVTLSATVREMEEAAELAAEMEEVQADEYRAVMRDLEGRDTVIRNLEDAIRMQRRREEDFQRTVTNYRSSVEKLRQEKTALLALQEGGEGEKSDLIAKSQKALAQAAQLVSDASKTRKREADAAFDRVDAQIRGHLCVRLESFLPQSVVASEMAAIKGELLLSKVAAKASLSLSGVASNLSGIVRAGLDSMSEMEEAGDAAAAGDGDGQSEALVISDEAAQQIVALANQARFARIAVDAASTSLRLLSAGQWPDILSPKASAALGAAALRSLPPVDAALGEQLRILKEEGGLSPHRSNLGPLENCVRDAAASLASATDAEGGEPLLPAEWCPPGLVALRDVSRARFDCLGAAAALASAVSSPSDGSSGSSALYRGLAGLLSKADQICTESTKACQGLTGLRVNDENVVAEASAIAKEWKELSKVLLESVEGVLTVGGKVSMVQVQDCETKADRTLKSVVMLSSCLRGSRVVGEEGKRAHPLSPETEDPWAGITELMRKIRVVDGDEDDINYLLRARAVERQLTEAIDNESKLSIANTKVTSLEKSLVSRSKEISMQNARLADLEQMLAQTTSTQIAVKSPIGKGKGSTSDEIKSLKEENRMLTEAMDVLHGQVDEYEREIRALKDSSKGRTPKKSHQKKNASFDTDFALSQLGQSASVDAGGPVTLGKTVALEAALFRPALRSARSDASAWKAKAMESSVMRLPPLSVPKASSDAAGVLRCAEEVSLASAQARIAKASFRVIDLTKASSRIQLREELSRTTDPIQRLDEASSAARHMLAKLSGRSDISHIPTVRSVGAGGSMLGKVTIPGRDKRVVSLAVHKNELRSLHSHFLQ